MSRVYLIDASGSMTRYQEEVEVLLGATFPEDVIVATAYDDVPIEVVSDVDESADVDLSYKGSTPLGEAIEALHGIVSNPIVVVTDGKPDHAERYNAAKEAAPVPVREIDVEALVGDRWNG